MNTETLPTPTADEAAGLRLLGSKARTLHPRAQVQSLRKDRAIKARRAQDETDAWVYPDLGDVRSVFAYGTLRHGEGNYNWTVGDLPHRIQRGVLRGWVLLGLGASFPYAVPGTPTDWIIGDVLTFPPAAWPDARARMDRLEGVPHLYRPTLVTVRLVSGEDIDTVIYEPVDKDRISGLARVPNGDWVTNGRGRW